MRIHTLLVCLLISFCLAGQENVQEKSNAIVSEGKKLYRSEMASWYGTDIFLSRYKELNSTANGYLSYSSDNGAYCLFFTKGEQPKVLLEIVFDSTYNTTTAKVSNTPRLLSPFEYDLYVIREKALQRVNTDSSFRHYQNSNLNLIPLIHGSSKKVYIVTGSTQSGTVFFGNDYLLTFDAQNNIVDKQQLHKNIIPVNYSNKTDANGNTILGSMHTHLPETGDLITATDVCTLMLYERFSTRKQHIIVAQKHVSIWDCEKDNLVVLTKEAWNKMNEGRKK